MLDHSIGIEDRFSSARKLSYQIILYPIIKTEHKILIDFSRFRLGSGKNTRQFHGLIAVFSCRSRYNGLLSVIIVTALEWNQVQSWLGDQVIQLIKNKCVKKHLQLKSFS